MNPYRCLKIRAWELFPEAGRCSKQGVNMVNFEDFSRLDLKIGKILTVSDHPDADRLYVLKVDIGEKKIQLVAGLKKHYSPEELEGKSVVVLTNLEPRVLRGVESQGMLLAAQSNDKVTVLVPDTEVDLGSTIR